MYLRKSVFTLLLILCNVFVVVAQTTADSLALVTAHWNVTSMGKGVLCREAEFVSLYGVPQHVAILEILSLIHISFQGKMLLVCRNNMKTVLMRTEKGLSGGA